MRTIYNSLKINRLKTHQIKQQTRFIGGATVEIISLTPKSISFWYKASYVDLMETTNAAQYHCQKNKLDAVLKKEEDLEYGGEMKAYFDCK